MAITYRGTTIPFAKHNDSTTPRSFKSIAFPAVNGTEEMDMGKRARVFIVVGLITDMLTGSFTKDTLEGWIDGAVGTLAIHGTSYSKVKLRRATFAQAYKNAVSDTITCTFTAEFVKLQ